MKQKNKQNKTKRAQVDPLKVIMLAVILIVVVIVIIMIFRNIFGKQAKALEEQVSGLSDYDNDGSADFLDPCPCEPDREPPCGRSAEACRDEIKRSKS